MLRSGLLFAIALLSLAALLVLDGILWDAESHDAVTKLVALQVLCLLYSESRGSRI